MGNSKRLFADSRGLSDHDVAKLARDGLAAEPAQSSAVHGFALRDGQSLPFTLDASLPGPETRGIMFEQYAIAALLMVSFVAPIFELLR